MTEIDFDELADMGKHSPLSGLYSPNTISYMDQSIFPLERWYSSYNHDHPDCTRFSWTLRIYHNTRQHHLIELICSDCGLPIDPAEICVLVHERTCYDEVRDNE